MNPALARCIVGSLRVIGPCQEPLARLGNFGQPEWEYHTDSRDPDTAIHRGIDAVTRQFAIWLDAYPDLKVEPLEAKDAGEQVFLWVLANYCSSMHHSHRKV